VWAVPGGYVKIIASLGPSARDPGLVERMAQLGVSGFRINFAHGDPSLWEILARNVRLAEEKTGKPLALMGDLVGPSIRLGVLHEPVVLEPGQRTLIVLAEEAPGGSDTRIPLPLPRFFDAVEEGDILVMNDGRVRLRVVEVGPGEVVVEAITPAKITSRKAIVVLGKDIGLPSLTQRDLEAAKFAVEHGFDYIALSYVRGAEDIEALRGVVEKLGGNQAIAAKIENRSAVENLDQIVEAADLVIVARGDLGMNYGLEEIPALQERIVRAARRAWKPVIVATQILESMIENPVPTRAEVTDVYVAVSQGVDALMLTGETAIGKHPLEAVRWLRRITRRAEQHSPPSRCPPRDRQAAYAASIAETAERLGAGIVLAYSIGGTLPPRLAAARPSTKVIIGTASREIARRAAIQWGLEPVVLPASSYEEGLEKLETLLCSRGDIAIGDLVVETYRYDGEHRVTVKQVLECPAAAGTMKEDPQWGPATS
jgi:pyruvate kinase